MASGVFHGCVLRRDTYAGELSGKAGRARVGAETDPDAIEDASFIGGVGEPNDDGDDNEGLNKVPEACGGSTAEDVAGWAGWDSETSEVSERRFKGNTDIRMEDVRTKML